MFQREDRKYWAPIYEVLCHVEAQIPEGARVLEIGPGQIPFSRATHFVDMKPGDNTVVCDVQHENLPFEDKSFDFIYTRHVVEDLIWPFPLLREMSRVGKAGYIETPSPLAETTRGVDNNTDGWRGYFHHHWLVWNQGDTLKMLRKYPLFDHRKIGDDEELLERALRVGPFLWNSHYLWRDEIKWRMEDIDQDNVTAAAKVAVDEGMAATRQFLLAAATG